MVDASQTGEARRAAMTLAESLGFGETERGRVAIVATEAATNLVKHARDGLLLLRPLEAGGRSGIEILALDRGPGFADIGQAIGDGFSTAGSSGTGLGAMRRLSADFDLHSVPGAGTTVVATLWADDADRASAGAAAERARTSGEGRVHVGVISLPHPMERVCGDAFAVHTRGAIVVVLVADGLGHGPLAAQAANAVVTSFLAEPERAPSEILEMAHAAARPTRGAAVAVAYVNLDERRVRYAGAGNIVGLVLAPGRQQSMVSHSGTVGHTMRRAQEFTYDWPEQGVLVMHSDGLTSSWNIDRYPGLVRREPALLAATLYRDAARGRDDATVVVVRAREDAAA